MIDRGITDWKMLNGKWKVVRRSKPQVNELSSSFKAKRAKRAELAKLVKDYELEVSEGAVGQNKGEFCEAVGCDGKVCKVCNQRKV